MNIRNIFGKLHSRAGATISDLRHKTAILTFNHRLHLRPKRRACKGVIKDPRDRHAAQVRFKDLAHHSFGQAGQNFDIFW